MAPVTLVAGFAVMIPLLFGGSGACAPAASTTGPTSDSVSVMTWNVCAHSCSNWVTRAPAMTEVVSAAGADIVAVQEGGWGVKDRTPTLSGIGSLGYANAQEKGPFIGRYIFFKPRKFKQLRAGGFSLGGTHGISWVKLRTIADRKDFVVVNVHLVNGQSAATDAQRAQQMATATAKLAPVIGDLPVMWVGDFNSNSSRATDTPTAALAALDVTDSVKRAAQKTNADVNSARDRSPVAEVKRSGHQVDHIYTSPDFTVFSWAQLVNASGPYYVPPFITDHNPLMATIGLGDTPAPSDVAPASFNTSATDPAAPAPAPAPSAASPKGSWTPDQLANASAIVGTGRTLNVSGRGQAIAVMTALGESGLKVLDYGDKAGPDSRGLFQQRDSWGPMSERMDPQGSARLFFAALVKVDGWESMKPTDAAHAVQRNADPNYYTRFWAPAQEIITLVGGDAVGGGEACGGDTQLVNLVIDGVSFPLPADSGYTPQNNFGSRGGNWKSIHTGTDYSVTCGTPVFAVTRGTVIIDKKESGWAGPFPVKLSTGKGRLTTWYAHMQSVTVAEGQQVNAGDQIGSVGSLGNSTGCHLHFEVHPTGGSIYQDPIDPVPWLAAQLSAGAAA
jgi:murein DD-endopeptidase MepM/ murein hydrolase activator NlpD/endonuclease/exonuclease/phosphatase family metal-dependent hydrolase